MLPYKKARGKEAFKRIMCYKGVPEGFAKEKMLTLQSAHVKKLPSLKYVKVGDICKLLGGKL